MFEQSELSQLRLACREGRWIPLARAISRIENTEPWEVPVSAGTHVAHVIGITGPPGVGKSTLTAALIAELDDAGQRVAVLAIDPSSPITGGAVLGDRLRMERHLLGRSNVYVRSLASRGSHGALAAATRNVTRLLELTGAFDVIVIETVGAGQSEVAIASLADTVLLVTVPGLGDAVQAIKAGFLEVANVVVVNKADRPDAAETVRHLRTNLSSDIEVLQTSAINNVGVADLCAAIGGRWQRLLSDHGLASSREAKFSEEVALLAESWVRSCARAATVDSTGGMNYAVRRVLEEALERWKH